MMSLPRTPSFRLHGERAIVTGASVGVGIVCAVALADENLTAHAPEMDVANVAETCAAIGKAGPFDIRLNSAGTARHAPASENHEADFSTVSDLNFNGRSFLTNSTIGHPERRARTEDIMGADVFLASDASALITGSALMIDGGRTAK